MSGGLQSESSTTLDIQDVHPHIGQLMLAPTCDLSSVWYDFLHGGWLPPEEQAERTQGSNKAVLTYPWRLHSISLLHSVGYK